MQTAIVGNNRLFFGKVKKTKKGNEYEKSNEGKKIVPAVIVGREIFNTVCNSKKNKKKYALLYQNLKKYSKKEGLNLSTDVIKKRAKQALIAGKVYDFAGIALFGLLAGIIIDAITNSTRRKDSDDFQQTRKVPEKTNKGKKIGAGIGLGLGGISALRAWYKGTHKRIIVENNSKLAEKISSPSVEIKVIKKALTGKQKIMIALGIPLITALCTAYAAIYDYAVNKSRAKLTDKILDEKAKEAIK